MQRRGTLPFRTEPLHPLWQSCLQCFAYSLIELRGKGIIRLLGEVQLALLRPSKRIVQSCQFFLCSHVIQNVPTRNLRANTKLQKCKIFLSCHSQNSYRTHGHCPIC